VNLYDYIITFFFSSKCPNYLSDCKYVSNNNFHSFEHNIIPPNSPNRISHINNHYNNNRHCSRSMDHHHLPPYHRHQPNSSKSILKRKSVEVMPAPDEDCSTPATNADVGTDDPRPQQCSLKTFNPKSFCRQGILKKQSASFDDESTQKPILKNRCQSCDDETLLGNNFSELHSILKRKTSEPSPEPPSHGILKRRGERDVRPPRDRCQTAAADEPNRDGPRPILKKVLSAVAADDKRPILKPTPANMIDGPTKHCSGSSSKRPSVAQRISDLESGVVGSDDHGGIRGCRLQQHARGARDRTRFRTQPVTPSEINAVKKYVFQGDFRV